eukprot:gnl/TRDRNA2_/TRDRNA2_85327_c0_seq1.p1 gnl/TRDRNA2_/TRDRNA2_85327_c0~~gnl/TRDRNA2_/TRDRNA2_85327_c0_seq1.p1  ORF type:complete len:528 (+),score=69.48 gnl/TRDRNA2_/TRDRNA2_85327_c0_seq1:155-1738(+)
MAGTTRYQPLVSEDTNGGGQRGQVYGLAEPVGRQMTPRRSAKGDRSCKTAWEAGKFVLDPHTSKFLPMWDSWIFILIVYVSIEAPYSLGFPEAESRPATLLSLSNVLDAFFWSDICLQILVAYPDEVNHRWVKRPKMIAKHYLFGMFWVDVISCLPYKEIIDGIRQLDSGRKLTFLDALEGLSLLRIVRLLRVSRLMARYESRVDIPYMWVDVLKLLVVLSLTMHWLACCLGMVLVLQKFRGSTEASWVDAVRAGKPDFFKQEGKEEPFEIYTAALYWSVMTTTSIGYGDVTATNDHEAWFMIVAMGLSGMVWAYVIGSVCGIATTLDAENIEFENKMDSLNIMMKTLDLPSDLRLELREYYLHRKLAYHRTKQVALLSEMSPALQGRVSRWVQASMFSQIWFFREATDGFVAGVFRRLAIAYYPPRELVRLSNSLVILTSGLVFRGHTFLSKGAVWGITELLLENPELYDGSTPLSLSFSEFQYLTRKELYSLCEFYPEEYKMVRKATTYMTCTRGLITRAYLKKK